MNFGSDYQGGDSGGGYGGGGGGGDYGGGGGGSFSGGGSQTPKQRKSYDEQTLIPVTARMVLTTQPSSSSDGTGSLALRDKRELHQVKLVGAVRSFDAQSTNFMFQIEDGTGLVEVKQWVDDNEASVVNQMRQECLQEHVYVRVIGQVKEYDGKKSIVAHSIRKVSSGNELIYHMLEVVYCAERFKRKDTIINQPMMHAPAGVGFGAPQGMGVPISASAGGSGNELLDAVKEYFKVDGEADDYGAPITGCVAKLTATGKFNAAEVRDTIQSLATEGAIYSTVNEDHYKFVF